MRPTAVATPPVALGGERTEKVCAPGGMLEYEGSPRSLAIVCSAASSASRASPSCTASLPLPAPPPPKPPRIGVPPLLTPPRLFSSAAEVTPPGPCDGRVCGALCPPPAAVVHSVWRPLAPMRPLTRPARSRKAGDGPSCTLSSRRYVSDAYSRGGRLTGALAHPRPLRPYPLAQMRGGGELVRSREECAFRPCAALRWPWRGEPSREDESV